MTRKLFRSIITLIFVFTVLAVNAQRNISFNSGWTYTRGGETKHVTLPRAWNEAEAFRVSIENLSSDTVRYVRQFMAPKSWRNKKVFIEFEGARQCAEVWINGIYLGRHENGVMAFGFDLTPYIKIETKNTIEVLTDNDWGYREKEVPESLFAAESKDGNNLPNNSLKPGTFQWNNKNFNANYGGLPKNVKLHVVDRLYQTLPLYSNLETTGTYIYATNIDVAGRTAEINAESEVKNESDKDRTIRYEMEVYDREGHSLDKFTSGKITIHRGQIATLRAGGVFTGLHFWSWGYGYLYTVKTRLIEGKKTVDVVNTVTGFRKTEFEKGQFRLNDRTMMIHGYAQRTSNEWPGLGIDVPAWVSDYSNGLMVESGGNLVRWMHVCPSKQDVESCDRVGLMQAMPAGDAEKDVTGRQWQHRTELMRDAIIYNRNNPSIIFYECGNKGITESHMREMKRIREEYDPYGGRAIGCREMLNHDTSAEYGGEMLYINKSATKPVWAMEYCRDEALRKYWDNWSYPFHKEGDGPLYKGEDASAYNHNNDEFAVEMVRRWYDYWMERPGSGSRISSGGVKIVFSDTNTHHRGESIFRTSGVVDPMRIEKDAFYAHQVMWNGWVTPDSSVTHIVGHWNYPKGTVKPVYVISDAPHVRLFCNNREVGKERIKYHFLHVFDNVRYEAGQLLAVSYDDKGNELSYQRLETAGDPIFLSMGVMTSDRGMKADGADVAIIQVEVTDRDNRRCPTADNMIHFELEGPIEWIGNELPVVGNAEKGYDVPLTCGVTRILVRSTGAEGKAVVRASSKGVTGSSYQFTVKNRKDVALKGSLYRGETPSTPSYADFKHTVKVKGVTAGCNQAEAYRSMDDSEDTEWKNDGRLSTAWITYELERPAAVNEVVLKLTGWRKRQYPLQIFADDLLVWEGKTDVSLGYVHLPLSPINDPAGRTICPVSNRITIRLKGTASDSDAFGQITELAAPVANELDLFKAKDGDKVKSELRIVEADFLQWK